MHNIYGGMYFFSPRWGFHSDLLYRPKTVPRASACRGPTVRVKSATLAGQLCIEVAYFVNITVLWEHKNNSSQMVDST